MSDGVSASVCEASRPARRAQLIAAGLSAANTAAGSCPSGSGGSSGIAATDPKSSRPSRHRVAGGSCLDAGLHASSRLTPGGLCLRGFPFEVVCGSCLGGAFGSASPGTGGVLLT